MDILIPVRLDEKTFKRFARFDMFILRRRWVRPAVFSLLFFLFALAALFSRRPQAGLLSSVLFTVGIGLPVVYIGTFLSQVNMQALSQRLSPARRVYTLHLTEEGVSVTNDQKKEDPLFLPWKEVRQAIRAKGCIYLYVSPQKAFLLPDGQADAPDEALWALIEQNLGQEKCQIRARKF